MRNGFIVCLLVMLGACALDEPKATPETSAEATSEPGAICNDCPRPTHPPVTEQQAKDASGDQTNRDVPGRNIDRIKCDQLPNGHWDCDLSINVSQTNWYVVSCHISPEIIISCSYSQCQSQPTGWTCTSGGLAPPAEAQPFRMPP